MLCKFTVRDTCTNSQKEQRCRDCPYRIQHPVTHLFHRQERYEPKRWQLHNINEIMNTVVTGWKPFSNPRMFAGYGRQKGWERDVSGNELPGNEDGFVELSEEECRQLELPNEWIA